MSIDKTKVVGALTKVNDPKTGKDIITQSMVRDLVVEGNNINFTIEMGGADAATKQQLNFACIAAVQELYPSANVNVHMMMSTAKTKEKPKVLPQVKNIIAVASGKGGVGKSTVATNLALGLKETGARVGLIDADLYGPSIPTMLGLQGQRPQVKEVNGAHKIIPLDAYGMPVMSIGFIIEAQQAVVLRGPRLGAIIRQFINDCIWPELDYLVIDLPPGTGDIQLTLVQTVPITGAILVTTPQEVAVADAIKAMNMFLLPSVSVPVLGVVENMSWFTPAELPDNKYYIFGEGGGKRMAELSESMLLGQLPIVQGIREAGDVGKPIVLHNEPITKKAVMHIVDNVARQVAIRNEMLGPTQTVKMNV